MRNIYKQFQLLSLFLFFLGTFLICCQGISSAKTSDDEFVVRKLGSIEKRSGTENLDKPLSGISATTKAH